MKAVLSILRSASGVTSLLTGGSNAIYGVTAKQTQKAPFIVVMENMIEPYNSRDSGINTAKMLYRVFLFAHDLPKIKEIESAVVTALDNIGLVTYDGETIQSCYLESTRVDIERTDNLDYYMEEMNFEAIINT